MLPLENAAQLCSALLVRFEVCRRGEERKTLVQHITCGGRLGETCRGRDGGWGGGDGERSSLGNLFWSTQSADTQGAGKPITV